MERKKASGYIRVVTKDRNAIDEQKRNIENTAFENGYNLKEIYIDTGDGGDLSRDGIIRLIEDAKNRRIDVVVVDNEDILSTDKANTAELLEMFSTLNVSVYSIDGRRFLNRPQDTLENLSRAIYNTLSEMKENGVSLSNSLDVSKKEEDRDPTLKFQRRIIDAYLDLQQNDNRTHV